MSQWPPPAPGRVRISAGDASPRPSDAPQDFYADQLRRAQLRLSLSVALVFLVVLAVLAVGVSAWPLLEETPFAGLPLSWWLIGVALYPLVLGAALFYRAAASRLERRYAEVSAL